jgi:hypothetical protein
MYYFRFTDIEKYFVHKMFCAGKFKIGFVVELFCWIGTLRIFSPIHSTYFHQLSSGACARVWTLTLAEIILRISNLINGLYSS